MSVSQCLVWTHKVMLSCNVIIKAIDKYTIFYIALHKYVYVDLMLKIYIFFHYYYVLLLLLTSFCVDS